MMHAENSHELSPGRAITYVTAGRGKATLCGRQSNYTYKFGRTADHSVVFVELLTGPDDYNYIGFIPTGPHATHPSLVAGRKGNPAHPAFKALGWYLNKAFTNPPVAEQAKFLHEGVCGKCGRTLTTEKSIELGIGPVCRGEK